MNLPNVSAPVGVVPGVGCKFVPFCGPGPPPGRPVLPQTAIAFLGPLVGSKKSDAYLLTRQHIGHQRRDSHVAGVERQIERFFTVIFSLSA